MTREHLERLAEKINGKWPALNASAYDLGISFDITLDSVNPDNGPSIYRQGWDLSRNDLGSSFWIIWCLDRLEELGLNPQLVVTTDGYMVRCRFGVIGQAPTRAEALALALLQKLEEE